MKRQLLQAWLAIISDKKKAGALGALVVVALVMWARAAILSDAGPQKASASERKSDSRTSKSKKKEVVSGSDSKKNEPRAVVEIPVPAAVTRDLFAPSEVHFPLSSQTESAVEVNPKSAGGNDETHEQQEQRAREELERSVRGQASRLRLRSTIVGGEPIAVIEDTSTKRDGAHVMRIGESYNGFVLLKVESGRVLLAKEGFEVELLLRQGLSD
ncbi:MAG: hypothetical protein VYC34_04045 [Planctomycetota bacterium]|nr:hypothetical protein [Planctomycetota bacterium]